MSATGFSPPASLPGSSRINDDSLTTSSGSLTTPERPRKAVLVQEGNEPTRAAPAKAVLHNLGDHPVGGATHKGRASGADMQTHVMEGYAESASEESDGEREVPEQDRMRTPRRATSQGAAIMGQSPGTLAFKYKGLRRDDHWIWVKVWNPKPAWLRAVDLWSEPRKR